jgi:hypothetical protein
MGLSLMPRRCRHMGATEVQCGLEQVVCGLEHVAAPNQALR